MKVHMNIPVDKNLRAKEIKVSITTDKLFV